MTNTLSFWKKTEKKFHGPAGKRLYAIGDVHGCLDRLMELIEMIEDDNRGRSSKDVSIVLLGDLVDRGPDSAGVVSYWMKYRHEGIKPLHLIGNHEEMMIKVWDGAAELAPEWLRYGGDACIESYGLDPDLLMSRSPEDALVSIRKHIPYEHVAFLRQGYDRLAFGDYCLVHAGIDPNVPLELQTASQFHWMREPFLSWSKPLDVRVVHGHTISETVAIRPHRIGVDTGAYAGGPLSAICIEDDVVDVLSTAPK